MTIFLALQEGAATAAVQAPSLTQQMIPLVLIIAVFYFLLIRPQQKRFREHQNMVQSLKRGDKILTAGGIIGTIKKVDESTNQIKVEIAQDVIVDVARDTITNLVQKTAAPANDADEAAEKPKTRKKAASSAKGKK